MALKKPQTSDYVDDKISPQATDFEEAVLGGILYQGRVIASIVPILKPEVFYKEVHQIVYRVMVKMFNDDIPIDILTVTNALKNSNELDIVGGRYLLDRIANPVAQKQIEYYSFIIYQKFLQREVIRICHKYIQESSENMGDVFDLLGSLEKDIASLWAPLSDMQRRSSEDVAKVIEASIKSTINEVDDYSEVLYTDLPVFDEKIETARNKIVLFSGAAGDGKSKFISYWMFRILRRYWQKVSIKWITLEDSAEDVSTYFFSSIIMMTIKELKRKKYNEHQKMALLQLLEMYRKFDIDFEEQSKYIDTYAKDFELFCQRRPGRFNILVVDNILSLKDREKFGRDLNAMYDYTMNRILNIKQKTKALIIVVHHYNDAQQDKINIKTGYRPNLKDIKGTEAFRRVPNQVLLSNNPSKRKDLLSEYYGEKKEALKHLFIIDPGKIRDDDNVDDSSLMYFYADLGYSIFYEIPRIIK